MFLYWCCLVQYWIENNDYGNRRPWFLSQLRHHCVTLGFFVVLNFLNSKIVNWSDSKDSSSSDFNDKSFQMFFLMWKKMDVNSFSHLFVFQGYISTLRKGIPMKELASCPKQESLPSSSSLFHELHIHSLHFSHAYFSSSLLPLFYSTQSLCLPVMPASL